MRRSGTVPIRTVWRKPSLAILVVAAAMVGSADAQQLYDPTPTPTSDKEAVVRKSKQYQRWRFAYERRGRLHPHDASRARAAALEVLDSERARHPEGALTWSPLGPAPIVSSPNASGRVSTVAVDPSFVNHWLVGAAQGGIWETTDAGASWAPLTDNAASLAMGAIAFAPSNANVVYAGTGEAHFSGDSYGGAGVLKSTDNGATWTLLAADTFRGTAFSDIRVDPTNANVVTAAVSQGVAGRYATFPPSLPPRGVYRTTDGGVSWSLTLGAYEATDLEHAPGDFARQYAGVKFNFQSLQGGLYRSFDGGQTWSTVAGPWATNQVGRVELAIAPSAPNRLYAAIDSAQTSTLVGVWVTDNAWDPSPTWVQLPSPPCPSYQYWYDFEASVDPQDPQRLYLGGVGICRWSGSAWSVVGGAIHVDQHAMAWVGSRLIVGNDGGVYSTTNGGNTWSNHNTNLSLTQYYDGVLSPLSPSFALGGSQDNGTQKWTGAPAWVQIFGADGGDCEIPVNNPGNQNWAVTTQGLGVYRTLNGGSSFQFAGSGITGYVPFIARLVMCPRNDDVFVAGSNPLHKTTNFFGTGAPPTWLQNAPEFLSTVQSLDFAPSDPTCGTYLAGTDWPELMLTTDGGGTWRDLHVSGTLPFSKYPVDVAFHPTNPNVVYVALSGFDVPQDVPGHLFKTENALSASPTWTRIGPPVDLPHNTVLVDPSRPSVVYVGTDVGVWRSTDTGGTWTPLQGLPNVAVFDLQANARTGSLVAFTHGRGAWRLPLASVSFAAPASTVSESAGVALVPVQVERSDGGALEGPVTVAYRTDPITASPGDFVETNGTLTFTPGTPSGGTSFVAVPLIDDPGDEPPESFQVRLTVTSGALLGSAFLHTVTIDDDDAPPTVVAVDVGLVEGNAGSTPASFRVSLSAGSAFPITMAYTTADGTATAGVDYTAAAGVLTFPLGFEAIDVPVLVTGDTAPETDETFRLELSAPVNATLADGTGVATVLDDDTPSLSPLALLHGGRVQDDLAAAPGPTADVDFFHLSQSPRSSYEVVADAVSGDVQPLGLDRVAGDGLTTLQSAAPAGAGGSWRMSWENTLVQPVEVQYLRVRSGQCTTDCGTDDQYRLRLRETTLAAARFNNSGTQVSVLVLQNTTDAPIRGHEYYWSTGGGLLLTRAFEVPPRSTQVTNLSTLPVIDTLSGSLTVTHDGAYGVLAGKVVAVEPATGFAFDTLLTPRP